MNFRPRGGAAEDPRIEIAPLIDVVFLLLLFFLLTTTFARHRAIDVTLPESGSTETVLDDEELVVLVGADGSLLLGDRPVDSTLLGRALEQAAREDPDRILLLRADREVSHGRVVSVMDMAREAGLRRISIVTKGRSRPPDGAAEDSEGESAPPNGH